MYHVTLILTLDPAGGLLLASRWLWWRTVLDLWRDQRIGMGRAGEDFSSGNIKKCSGPAARPPVNRAGGCFVCPGSSVFCRRISRPGIRWLIYFLVSRRVYRTYCAERLPSLDSPPRSSREAPVGTIKRKGERMNWFPPHRKPEARRLVDHRGYRPAAPTSPARVPSRAGVEQARQLAGLDY